MCQKKFIDYLRYLYNIPGWMKILTYKIPVHVFFTKGYHIWIYLREEYELGKAGGEGAPAVLDKLSRCTLVFIRKKTQQNNDVYCIVIFTCLCGDAICYIEKVKLIAGTSFCKEVPSIGFLHVLTYKFILSHSAQCITQWHTDLHVYWQFS